MSLFQVLISLIQRIADITNELQISGIEWQISEIEINISEIELEVVSEWWFHAVSATEIIFTARTLIKTHKSLYSAAAFKKSKMTSGLTI